ncbi:hypothetical protein BOTNAR_0599g00040 [Botryotinia narcissicola]|uniref:Uncharacterized protein n=1 Tax=Botryotinia narcissicola TaxID=278944 RepID=A0A4Z1HBQ7_9HELO|nr:hypothetical protein BOTNAR_0599g00040 [Botryotinia narcissicola]
MDFHLWSGGAQMTYTWAYLYKTWTFGKRGVKGDVVTTNSLYLLRIIGSPKTGRQPRLLRCVLTAFTGKSADGTADDFNLNMKEGSTFKVSKSSTRKFKNVV